MGFEQTPRDGSPEPEVLPEPPAEWEDPSKVLVESDYGPWRDPGKPEQRGESPGDGKTR